MFIFCLTLSFFFVNNTLFYCTCILLYNFAALWFSILKCFNKHFIFSWGGGGQTIFFKYITIIMQIKFYSKPYCFQIYNLFILFFAKMITHISKIIIVIYFRRGQCPRVLTLGDSTKGLARSWMKSTMEGSHIKNIYFIQ